MSKTNQNPGGGLNAEATKLVGRRIADLEKQNAALLAALEKIAGCAMDAMKSDLMRVANEAIARARGESRVRS